MSTTILRSFALAALVLGRAAAVHAACSATEPPNIILFIADDLGAPDLPLFSPGVDWSSDPATQKPSLTYGAPAPYQFTQMRPDLNRLVARMLAGCNPQVPDTCGASFGLGRIRPAPLAPGVPAPDDYLVVPWDRAPMDGTDPFTYAEDAGDTHEHILHGAGGIARIAERGFAFNRYYATSGVCSPTRASILTGRYPEQHGVRSISNVHLPRHEVTIGEYLSEKKSYSTGLIGKWHVGGEPWEQGFHEFVGHARGCCRGYFSGRALGCGPDPADPTRPLYVGRVPGRQCPRTCDAADGPGCCCTEHEKLGFVLEVPDSKVPPDTEVCGANGAPGRTGDATGQNQCNYSVRLYRDLAIDYISRHEPEAQPFFLVVAFNAVHAAHDAPKRTQEHYGGDKPLSKPRYWGAIEEIDAAVGQILDALGSARSNTIVLFTSDQGYNVGGNAGRGAPTLRGGKHTVYEGGIRVGLVGSMCGADPVDLTPYVASHVDVFPTLAEAAGAPVDPVLGRCEDAPEAECSVDGDCPADDSCLLHPIAGRSLYALLTGASTAPVRSFAYAKYGEITVATAPLVEEPARVCGYLNDGLHGVAVRGGSCMACTSPTDCEGAVCGVVGRVCVSPTATGTCPVARIAEIGDATDLAQTHTCGDGGSVCSDDTPCDCGVCVYDLPQPATGVRVASCRTDADCEHTVGAGWHCEDASTECTECLPAAWKVKPTRSEPGPRCPGTVDAPDDHDALYELTTNPSETDGLNCLEAHPDLWRELRARAVNWDHCAHEWATFSRSNPNDDPRPTLCRQAEPASCP